ncbi:MAG: glycosyltransferase [Flavobacteriales bacterium]|jgi:glycosyltransferase involved in cell wall biosynthesis|nr:glycosyltransferase [Flavobacteriales bacterium]MBP6642557.1 glycosyltransferase [Flavobacteriales bacterium]HQW41224.1 glycosyltransferase [Flavobacteriales bacterium]
MRRAFVTVTNDLATDNRVHRTCTVLQELGYNVLLVGRVLPGSPALDRPYGTKRMRLLFSKGALFYAEYNVRLFFLLLFSPFSLVVANDLDTLLAAFLGTKLKGGLLVYDSHEYFTEVPELAARPSVRRVWLAIERWIFPKLKKVITVNDSIADAYKERYGVRPTVVRNIPMPRELGPLSTRLELGLPMDRTILIMQGSGINVQRGAEEAVLAVKELPECLLLMIGGGDAWPVLEQLVKEHDLADRVRMLPRMPYEAMMQYTRNADLGLSLDKDTNLNYRFSLPNKLFDYFRAGIPALVTDLPEVAGIVRKFDAGIILPAPEPALIAATVRAWAADATRREALRRNATFAAVSLDGQRELEALKAVFQDLG